MGILKSLSQKTTIKAKRKKVSLSNIDVINKALNNKKLSQYVEDTMLSTGHTRNDAKTVSQSLIEYKKGLDIIIESLEQLKTIGNKVSNIAGEFTDGTQFGVSKNSMKAIEDLYEGLEQLCARLEIIGYDPGGRPYVIGFVS